MIVQNIMIYELFEFLFFFFHSLSRWGVDSSDEYTSVDSPKMMQLLEFPFYSFFSELLNRTLARCRLVLFCVKSNNFERQWIAPEKSGEVATSLDSHSAAFTPRITRISWDKSVLSSRQANKRYDDDMGKITNSCRTVEVRVQEGNER